MVRLYYSIAALVFSVLALGASVAAAQEDPPTSVPVMEAWGDDVLPPEPPPWVETMPSSSTGDDDPTPGFFETSEFLIGSVAVGVVFVESDGTIDPDTEEWTAQQQDLAMRKLQAALDWWAAQEPKARVSFQIERAETSVPVGYEPVSRSGSRGSDKALWVSQAMEGKGFKASDFAHWGGLTYLGQVYDYVNDLRSRRKTDWAFTIFFVNDTADPDHSFGGSAPSLSFAALSGPYIVALYNNGNYGPNNLNKILAHEMGHIFGATDTYDGLQSSGGYFAAPDVDGRYGLMNHNDFYLPEDTRQQLGWRDSDGDKILDPIDTDPFIELIPLEPNPTDALSVTLTGRAMDIPLPNRNVFGRRPVSLNRILAVEYRVNGGLWQTAAPRDGTFDRGLEGFELELRDLEPGQHRVEARAVNTVSNASPTPGADAFLVTHILVKEIKVSAARAEVGSTQEVQVQLAWAHDGSPVSSGTVTLSGMQPVTVSPSGLARVKVTSNAVGRRNWTVQARSGAIQKTVTKATDPAIIWDQVQVTELEIPDERVNVGTVQPILARGKLEYDGTLLGEGDTLLINGMPAAWDAESKAFRLAHREDIVGRRSFTVTGAQHRAYGISRFVDTAGAKEIVWDRVRVSLEASPRRLDLGTEAAVKVSAIYEFDQTPFDGEVMLNQPLQSDAVGLREFGAAEVRGSRYGVTAFTDNKIPVIWDRVDITLTPVLARVQAGNRAQVRWTAHYAYDGEPLDGGIEFDTPFIQSEPGPQEYRVASVLDDRHGLILFQANTATVVFDRIQTTTSASGWRPGRLDVTVAARYETDGSPVEGMAGTVNETVLSPENAGAYLGTTQVWLPWTSYKATLTKEGFEPITVEHREVLWGNAMAVTFGMLASGGAGIFALRRRRED